MFDPKIGDIVCDCRYKHLKIIERDKDDLTLEDGSHCSLIHCCDDPTHKEKHPSNPRQARDQARRRRQENV